MGDPQQPSDALGADPRKAVRSPTSEPAAAFLPHETGICPICGVALQPGDASCAVCGSGLSPEARQQAQNQMGPWFLRDPRQPYRPGLSLTALLRLVDTGEIRRDSVLRGPTTRQFWRRADQIPGLAHHVGVCHVCAENADRNLTECTTCGAKFPEPDLRSDLGLAPMRTLMAQSPGAQPAHANPVSDRVITTITQVSEQPRPTPEIPSNAQVPPSPIPEPEARPSMPRQERPRSANGLALGIGLAVLVGAMAIVAAVFWPGGDDALRDLAADARDDREAAHQDPRLAQNPQERQVLRGSDDGAGPETQMETPVADESTPSVVETVIPVQEPVPDTSALKSAEIREAIARGDVSGLFPDEADRVLSERDAEGLRSAWRLRSALRRAGSVLP